MFLQKQRQMNEAHRNPSPPIQKLDDILKRISIPEIKSHKKGNPYLNPRDQLIHKTSRLFRQNPKQYRKQDGNSYSELSNFSQGPIKKNNLASHHSDLSTRESRVLAARRYRQRISKRSDITPYIKAQEALAHSRKSYCMRFSHNQSTDQVQRYRDMLKEFTSEGCDDKKQLIKTYWLAGGNAQHPRQSTNKNPQLPVTNIEFNEFDDPNATSKIIANRERRSSLRRNNYTSYSSQGRRNNRVNPTNFHDDNFIEPW